MTPTSSPRTTLSSARRLSPLVVLVRVGITPREHPAFAAERKKREEARRRCVGGGR